MVNVVHTNKSLRVLVTGGRHYAHREKVFNALADLLEIDEEHWMGTVTLTVIHGHCLVLGKLSGADRWADEFATVYWCHCLSFPLDPKDGSFAGFKRNQKMLDEGKPELVLAFPGGTGTADMVKRAKNAGIEVREIR